MSRRYNEGYKLYEAQQYEDAVEHFEQFLLEHPDDIPANLMMDPMTSLLSKR